MEPWERQPGETAKQFRAFGLYRDLGLDRSIDKAYAEHAARHPDGKKTARNSQRAVRSWQAWSSAKNWVERARAHDDHLSAQERQAAEAERLELAKRRARAEVRAQDDLEGVANLLLGKFKKLIDLPNTDISRTVSTQGDESAPPSKTVQKARGLKPRELCAVSRELREVIRVVVGGHAAKPVDGSAARPIVEMELVESAWPDGQGPEIDE